MSPTPALVQLHARAHTKGESNRHVAFETYLTTPPPSAPLGRACSLCFHPVVAIDYDLMRSSTW